MSKKVILPRFMEDWVYCFKFMQKILIVKIGAIGDVVMALPLISYFRDQYPSAHITWICSSVVAPLISATQKVDRIIIINEKALFKSSFFKRLKELLKVQLTTFFHYFDLILIGHVDWRYKLLPFFARRRTTRQFARSEARQIPVPGRYHAYEYLRLASDIDNPKIPSPQFPKLALPSSELVDKIFQDQTEKTKIAIAPGGAKNILANDHLRRWPITNYASLIEKLSTPNNTIFLLGSHEDQWVLPFFQGLKFVNLVGKLNILDLLATLRQCSLLITHDSGPLHLAKLVECPTIALFGPTNPYEKVGCNEKIKVLWGGETLACRPCYDGKTYAPCSQNLCLQKIGVDQVLASIDELLLTENL